MKNDEILQKIEALEQRFQQTEKDESLDLTDVAQARKAFIASEIFQRRNY
ncbi:MAG: hypothetical protein MJZ53_05070 [Paludibacteraceae bacterium]|nr:hypothetical protein [Paludibacteraceae bacterium]